MQYIKNVANTEPGSELIYYIEVNEEYFEGEKLKLPMDAYWDTPIR